MRRSTIICLIFLVFFSFGFRLRGGSVSGEPSKIYLYGTTLMRTVPGDKISLYDISKPSAPVERGTIAIEGNHDVAVQSHYMYADDNYDMVIFDIADISHPVALDTIHNVFTTLPQFNNWEGPMMNDVVTTGSSGCNSGCNMDQSVSAPAPAVRSTGSSADGGGVGRGGSTSRFVIVGNHLYCVDYSSLRVFDITQPDRPQFKSHSPIGWEIETIFPYDDKLFIGSTRGMYIYGTDDPELPSILGEFTHERGCDPVVAEGNRAYVTLRSGSSCGDNGDQMDIIDITDPRTPRLLNTVPLTGPYGLGVKNGTVLVCDGKGGLVILDVRDPYNVKRIGKVDITDPYDVILDGNMMIVTADAGVYLYDISNIASPTLYRRMDF